MSDTAPSQSAQNHLRMGMVAWNALPALLPRFGSRVGGLETGAWTLAQSLAAHTQLEPHFFVRAGYHALPSRISDVQVHAVHDPLSEIRRQVGDCIELTWPPKIRQLRPALLWQIPLLALLRPWRVPTPAPQAADPRLLPHTLDAWAGFGVNADSLRVVLTAVEQGKPSLLFLESNADLDVDPDAQDEQFNAYGESSQDQRLALQHAHTIVCQSEFQQRLLKQRFGRDGELLRNPIDRQQWSPGNQASRQGILWIGRYDNFHKRPHLAFEIARQCPTQTFEMIINPGDPQIESELRNQVPGNVQLLDYVPFDQMPSHFARAEAFLCTGSPAHEGFPNVLLQAAACHTPIVSLSDFDGFLKKSGAGFDCNEAPNSAADILNHLPDRAAHIDWANVDRYIDAFHSAHAIANATADLVTKVCAQKIEDAGANSRRSTSA